MNTNAEFPIIAKAKVTVAGNLGVDFTSRNRADYVSVLNRAAEALGAVPNMGIYADITSITGCSMLKVTTCDTYLDISLHDEETPKKSLTNKNNATSVDTANLDLFAGDGTETVEGILGGTIENHRCDKKVACHDCDGSGQCRDCNGTGKVRCNHCHGNGECPNCQTEGYVQCSTCHGTGDVVQQDGATVTCPSCKGKGDLKCTECHGDGHCHTCKGKGTVACGTCHGSGKCHTCKGTGELRCPRCEGSGWFQTYTSFTARRVVNGDAWVSHEDYKKMLDKAEGRSVFSGRVKKWHKFNVLEYDHTDRLRASVAAALGGDPRPFDAFAADHERTVKSRYGIRYIYTADAIAVPAVRIDFVLERVPHSMIILGTGGVVAHDSLPRRLEQYNVGLFTRLQMGFTGSKRRMEYIRLAAYIMQTDGRSPEESRLLGAFVRSLGYGNAKTRRLMAELEQYGPQMDYTTLRDEIRHLLQSRRVLTFAWQCMERDGQVSDTELALWQRLAAEFSLTEPEQQTLRANASRMALLDDEAMVEEYMRK